MLTIAEDQKVGDLTVRALKDLIKATVSELIDPDYGLEVKPEIWESLIGSRNSDVRIPAEQVAKELGLEW